MAAAATATAPVANNHSPKLFISRASIQLKHKPPTHQPPAPLIYEWRTQVIKEAEEAPVECIKQNGSNNAAAAAMPPTSPPKFTAPRIEGNEATKRKNLPQTLCNFFEAERHDSAWNRVTK
ncbi:CG13117 [Drosophila busckii]|uniref:CG13117 n=1 Tax=Drosophila busckii TaxID=30019 RepID=A0A0M3QTL2_DROBS|nr:CG13117 [Drosophila busckii]